MHDSIQQAKVEQFEGVKKRAKATIDNLPLVSMNRLAKFAEEAERWLEQPDRKRFDGTRHKDHLQRAFSKYVREMPDKKIAYPDLVKALRPQGILPRDDGEAIKRLQNLASRNPRVYYQYPDGEVGHISRVNE